MATTRKEKPSTEAPKKKKKTVVVVEDKPVKKKAPVEEEVKKKRKKKVETDSEKPKRKKKAVKEEEVKKKRKKTSTGIVSKRELNKRTKALVKDVASGKISKLDSSSLQSILGDSADNIQALFEENDGDNAKNLLFKKMLQALVDLLPLAENNIRETGGQKGVYQFKTLVDSVRELMIDIQSSQDRGRMGELIHQRIIVPELMELGTTIILQLEMLRVSAKNKMTERGFEMFENDLTRYQDTIASEINQMARTVRQGAIEYLQR